MTPHSSSLARRKWSAVSIALAAAEFAFGFAAVVAFCAVRPPAVVVGLLVAAAALSIARRLRDRLAELHAATDRITDESQGPAGATHEVAQPMIARNPP